LWIAWILEGMALSAPILSLLPDSHPAWAQNTIFLIIVAPFALFFFLLFASAKLFCVPLGIAVCGVILSPDIRPGKKVLVAVVGCIAYASLLHWASVFQHTW
jgi:hypothetical protein